MAFTEDSNIFDDLFFSKGTPIHIIVAVFIYACKFQRVKNFLVVVVLPVVIRSSLMAKYFIYIGGMCDIPCNYFTGIMLPWILGAVVNHL